mgnify:CR=1 FL=1
MRLNTLDIAEPCDQDWHTMPGDKTARACAHCQKRVFDISELRREEIKDLFARRAPGQPLCLRIIRDSEGDVLTRDTKDERLVQLLRALSRRGRKDVQP